jgi:uncharacterized cupredoxin-like copper-binding protein
MRRALLVVSIAVASVACGSSGSGSGDVDVTLSDMQIEMSSTDLDAGQVSFAIENDGPSVHEAEVFSVPNAVDATQLPIDTGVADTSSLALVDEVEEIAPSTSVDLSASLDPGDYVMICNISGHYVDGMYATFTVS